MKENADLFVEIEDFNFTINTSTSTVSIPDLLSYLDNYNTLAKSVNHVLNKNGCSGYDQVVVEIAAFQHGSFNIFGHIKKITENPTFAAVGSAVVTALITKALNADPEPLVINNYQGGEIVVNYTELVENKDVVRARSRIAKTATSDSNVESISITYKNNGQDDEKTQTIDLTTLKSIIIDEVEDSKMDKSTHGNAVLRIIAPVLESEPANWKVSFDDKKISAYMSDTDFLSLMNETKIAFGKGDVIIADLEVTVKEEDGVQGRPKYSIRKVHQYPHYSVKEAHEATLFDGGTSDKK